MLEVFFCTAPRSTERREMAERCLAWWFSQPFLDVQLLTPLLLECSSAEFQRYRRIYADTTARNQFYILTDDDMLLHDPGMLNKGLLGLEEHPGFAILSAWPANANIYRWTPAEEKMRCLGCFGLAVATCRVCEGTGWWSYEYQPYEDLDVMEHVSVGGLRFCRKGIMDEWPDFDGQPGYDMAHCQALRKHGYRVGYLQHVRADHLGEGKTETWLTAHPART